MPHYIQFYENFIQNKTQLTIKTAAENLDIPHLIVHGTNDATVPLIEAENIHKWSSKSELFLIEDGEHGFGAKQPWEENSLPKDVKRVLDKTIDFIKKVQGPK